MDQDLQNYYKLTLAHDLIIFMMNIHNEGISNEQKARRTNMILEAWEKRVDLNVKLMGKKNIEELSETSGDDMDVLQIIQNIHSFESSAIRKEFKREVRSFTFKSYDKQTK
jgi:predicted DNA-binding protein YlxM (UPF0122 family)